MTETLTSIHEMTGGLMKGTELVRVPGRWGILRRWSWCEWLKLPLLNETFENSGEREWERGEDSPRPLILRWSWHDGMDRFSFGWTVVCRI